MIYHSSYTPIRRFGFLFRLALGLMPMLLLTLSVFRLSAEIAENTESVGKFPIPNWNLPHVADRLLVWSDAANDDISGLVSLYPGLARIRDLEPTNENSPGKIIEGLPQEILIPIISVNGSLISSGKFYVEPDYYLKNTADPNDPGYFNRRKWGLHNVGQNNGKSDADIDAREAWDVIHDASDIIVAVIDSGARMTHEDLKDNLWVNAGEIPGNGVDDDRNGYVDDVHGINAIDGTGSPQDDQGHGTHLSGIVGAVGNNGKGSVGVAWKVKLMPLKFIDSTGSGSTSDAIECIDYAIEHGANVINASWGNIGQSFFLERAVRRARNAGVVFVTAAGNNSDDIEDVPNFPASYTFDNILSVCATTERDGLVSFSNYGAVSVDLGAPGSAIYSTFYRNDSDYEVMSGSSMSVGFVAGSMALLMAKYPDLAYQEWISAMTQTVDPLPALEGRTVTGGRLNLNSALHYLSRIVEPDPASLSWQVNNPTTPRSIRIQGSPATVYSIEFSNDGLTWSFLEGVLTDSEGLASAAINLGADVSRWFRAVAVE